MAFKLTSQLSIMTYTRVANGRDSSGKCNSISLHWITLPKVASVVLGANLTKNPKHFPNLVQYWQLRYAVPSASKLHWVLTCWSLPSDPPFHPFPAMTGAGLFCSPPPSCPVAGVSWWEGSRKGPTLDPASCNLWHCPANSLHQPNEKDLNGQMCNISNADWLTLSYNNNRLLNMLVTNVYQ